MMKYGFVVDNKDPLKVGRCKVKLIGIHDGLSNKNIPWISPILPLNDTTVKPPIIGAQVACIDISHDGSKQHYLMLGWIPGIDDKTELPDTPDLARNEEIEKSIVHSKSAGKESTTEPDAETTYGAEYPFNKVYKSEAGHYLEFDDTPGKERIHVYHKSGSYIEMLTDGSVVVKSVSNKINIVNGNNSEVIAGNNTEMITGNNSEVIAGNNTETISGNLNITVTGSCSLKSTGAMTIESHSGLIKGLRCYFNGKPDHEFK